MPWKVYRTDDQWCVHKENADGSQGERVPGGCHASQAEANAQLRALYASEKKQSRFSQLVSALKELLGLEPEWTPPQGDLQLWKEQSGELRWLARYSNNFRDDDRPREIIAAKSHRRFIDLVDQGLAPMPELWVWHVPEWKLGQADWLAYDDAGFALAAGHIDPGKERAAEWLARQKGIRMSHGMPPTTIRRDEQDPTIIVEHETREISVLPRQAAANKLTGFVIFPAVKEADVTIPMEKAKQLIEQWGASPEMLEELQAQNARDAEKAVQELRDSKETGEEAPESPTETTPEPDPVVPTEPEPEGVAGHESAPENAKEAPAAAETEPEPKPEPAPLTAEFPTRAEVAEVVAPILEQIVALSAKIDGITKELSALAQAQEDQSTQIAKEIPAASLSALLAERLRAVGNPQTVVDGRSSLAKDKPKEAAPEPAAGPTPVPFLNRIITATPSHEQ